MPDRVYLAGPMSNCPNQNIAAFDAASKKLRSEGINVISPVDISRETGMSFDCNPTPEDYCRCMRYDLRAILDGCDAVYVLPGWISSRGARTEVHVAQLIGVPVLDYESRMPIQYKVITTCGEL